MPGTFVWLTRRKKTGSKSLSKGEFGAFHGSGWVRLRRGLNAKGDQHRNWLTNFVHIVNRSASGRETPRGTTEQSSRL